MNKNIFYGIVFCYFLLFPFSVVAMSPSDIKNRVSECPKIELALAKEDGSLEKIECYEDYLTGYEAMNNPEEDNLVLIEDGVIINAKYALVDFDMEYPKEDTTYQYVDVYVDDTSNITNGSYIRAGNPGPDDAALLDYNYETKRVKIKIAGLTGWLNKTYRYYNVNTYDIVPIAWVKSPHYYQAKDENTFIHYLPGNVYGTRGMESIVIDKKPEMLEYKKYYSYDGHYFYTSLKTMLKDYKENKNKRAVNKENPYYNYYQYLSFRTLTNHDVNNIDLYFQNRVSQESKLLSTGTYFVDTQNKYGVNAVLMLAIGMNESGRGTSNLAKTKNNLFGLNAVDASPGESANYFASVADCISTYGYVWLSYWYLQPGDFHYKGANLGNKREGLNYKYASDPYWAEMAAHYYYDLDKMFGFQDYNSYQLAVLNQDYNGVVYAKKTPGGENVSPQFYQYTIKDTPIVIFEEVEGPEVEGNSIWYKIQSDPVLDENLNYIGDSKSNPRILYNWNNSYVYVPAAYFTKVNKATGNIPDAPKQETVVEKPIETPEKPKEPQETSKPTEKPTSTKEPEPTKKPQETPEVPKYKEISAIIKEANYKYKENIIYRVGFHTSVEKIKKDLTNAGGVVKITDINGTEKTSGKLGTGDIIQITSGTTQNMSVLIYGDTNGDGEISAVDYVRIKNSIMGNLELNGIYKSASDVNSDGVVNAVDYVNIKNYIMGNSNVIKN